LFQFYCVIKSCTQKFTLFNQFGIPLRAEVTLVLQQHIQTEMFALLPQNPTSGGGPIERIWTVKAGDRLDLIADEVYKDSTKWRLIADRNGISNPLSIQAGQSLRIPPKSIGIS
jgi:prophage DNA circulation protein